MNGDGVGGARIDMGAYERQTVPGLNLVVDTPIDENDGDYSAGDLSLREAIGLANGSIGADAITFDAVVFATPQATALSQGEMVIGEALTLNGPGQQLLTIDAQQQSRIFNITAATGDFTIAGLTLTGGRTIEDSISGRGGAIRSLTSGGLTINQSTVSGNSTAGSSADGGGIYSVGPVTLAGSTVSGNATEGSFGSGGGIAVANNVHLMQSTVSGNSATGSGGGIFTRGGVGVGDVTLIGSIVRGNSTSGYEAYGGGIAASVIGEVTLTRSTVSGNSTSGERSFGGGIYANFGDVLLVQSTVSANYTTGATANGGGIFANATVSLMQSTVSGNSTSGNDTSGGGGIHSSTATLTYSTVTDNHVEYSNATGGGIRSSNGTFDISGSIVAGNTAGGGLDDVDQGTGTLSVNFSLIGTTVTPDAGTSGNNMVTDVPLLGPLANNGGPTLTHALLPGSLAIDQGDPSAVAGAGGVPLFDQRGNNFGRVQNGRIDMGAFEVRETPSADFDGDGFISGLDFLLWQIGLGTPAPNAVKTDGDADNDLDADSSDLDVWELQYGMAAPIVAAASALVSGESVSTDPAHETSLTRSELADVALAVALEEEAGRESSPKEVLAHSPPLEFFSAEPSRRSDSVSGPSISSSASTSTPHDDERQSPGGQARGKTRRTRCSHPSSNDGHCPKTRHDGDRMSDSVQIATI